MKYLGDLAPNATIRCWFNTSASTGAPITLAGSPAVRCYKASGTTEDDSGITLTVDFDGVTGLHVVTIDTSTDPSFYSPGNDFSIVLTAGTVDSVSVVGTTLGQFSLQNRNRLEMSLADGSIGDATIGAEGRIAIAAAVWGGLKTVADDVAGSMGELLVSYEALIQAAASAGSGDIAVDHDYGGADTYRMVHSETGEPIDDVQISAYAGSTTTGAPVARTRSGSDGRWTSPLMLDAGTYTLVFSKAGVFESSTASLTVT